MAMALAVMRQWQLAENNGWWKGKVLRSQCPGKTDDLGVSSWDWLKEGWMDEREKGC